MDTLNVLIVDDEEYRHSSFSRSYVECAVDHAYTYQEAVDFLKSKHYDIVQLDHDLGPASYDSEASRFLNGGHVADFIAGLPADRMPGKVIVHSFNYWGAQAIMGTCQAVGIPAVYIRFTP